MQTKNNKLTHNIQPKSVTEFPVRALDYLLKIALD